MKTPVVTGLLFRLVLAVSFSSLVACSSVLQANRLSRSFPRQPAETMANVPLESVPEQALFMDEARQPDAEATYGSPRSMALGYRWAFIRRGSTQNSPGLGNWVVKPNK